MTLILEGNDLGRFSRAGKFMSYTGLIPKKESSGTKDPSRKITKAGNSFLRLAIVGAAKFYRDRRYLISEKKLNEIEKPVRDLIIRCQNRLHTRYRYLCNKGVHSNKAKVAVARELSGFIWEFGAKIIPNINQQEKTILKQAA